jgi:nicotinamidase-related amidase
MKSAVLVIDIQRGLFDINPKPFESDKVVEKINIITSRARKFEVPVVFIQHEQKNGPLEYESENWELQKDLIVNDMDFKIRKTTPDSFLHTKLEKFLKANSVTNLIICGYASEFCVDTTVRRGAALGFTVQLVSDAHTTHNKEHASAKQIIQHHNATLPNISSFGVKISAIQTTDVNLKD